MATVEAAPVNLELAVETVPVSQFDGFLVQHPEVVHKQ